MEDGISMERILNTWSETDRAYMQEAIALAERGRGHTAPNPMVGCVIVKDGRTIGRGYHHRYGDLHAERDALAACAEDPAGATMYVTLEPCCHHGKQPPCTDAILAAGIARVVVGATDPNPLVGGRGIALLRSGGVAVEAGLLEAEIREQNRIFLKYITQKRPWVSLKVAMTLDGKIATADGDARWVSSEAARAFVQQLRGQRSGICVGAGTVRLDDPMLNCRAEGYRDPVRILPDSAASLSPDSRSRLGALGIDSLLLEGGEALNGSFVAQGLVDEYYFFIAPKILGGQDAKTAVGGAGCARMADAQDLDIRSVEQIGPDLLVHAYPKHH